MEISEEPFYLPILILPLILSFIPRFSLILQSLLSLILLIISISLILSRTDFIVSFQSVIPFLTFSYKVDNLSLFFVGLVSLLSFASSIYSVSYIKEFENQKVLTFLYNLFIFSMIMVILSANVPTFLIWWEIMSVVSFLLVIFDYKKQENLNAGIFYIFMTHLGTTFIIISFILLYIYSGSLEFKDFVNVNLPEDVKFLVFLTSLIGFGTKAGIFLLHFWLPKAHPVAPSNVSALMSGVMIKTAIYMLIRFYFEFLKDMPVAFGYIVLFIGALSAIYGILYAYVQTDIKKMLAYSSMENIGIILIAVGLAMIFKSSHVWILMGISFIAVLYHTLNHTVFKGLLFLGAGSVLFKTHTKNMEELGGLNKIMPKTGILFLIGILGITALPPFNGFVSEWLIYQSLLFGSKLNYEFISFTMPLFASVLALTGAFALGSFAKLYGTVFLGIGRTDKVKKASESDGFMLTGMGFLAFMVVILGLIPILPVYVIDEVLKQTASFSIYNYIIYKNGLLLISTDYDFGRISTSILAIAGIVIFVITYFLIRKIGNGNVREYETWACGLGESNLTVKAQYSASGFSQPIRRILSFVYKIKESLSFSGKKYFLPKKTYKLEIIDRIEDLALSLTDIFIKIVLKVRYFIQPGIIHVYIAYIILTLIAFIFYAVR
ncbi:MAG TPA: hydrogenase 4 subunit B [Sulfurihydrogenibium sp.]|uniref:proton-conducting transporter transmembrane domain-containing protein n=1 Tax=Sulfurihydrogenibium sp. (strain YO3AOP1) TaxID=436114 RepID=UPI000172379F|nr:proton-conducting transporter membrane subunit [Sulfurihydrogenibium sp. YO3AOP1]ACD66339.1 NADH dehydrogenase (quinone) [Sulfurihydrogenibium sp. YO3AOP1]HBT99102.1 hydrogenase 4 subunit B [Sulfurihydrogenibium sp.]